MGYLNNASVTVDAILTTKGREILSNGTTNGLDIRYFALGDDEVNYDLWNPAHPLGSDYYGIVIENMPVLEASPIPEQNLKSKLITLPKTTKALVYLSTSTNPIDIQWNRTGNQAKQPKISTIQLKINTLPTSTESYNSTLGYTYTYDSTYFDIKDNNNTPLPNSGKTTALGDSGNSTLLTSIVARSAVTIYPKALQTDLPFTTANNPLTTKIYVDGNEIGGRLAITVNLSQN
jgi:hypothetical protein